MGISNGGGASVGGYWNGVGVTSDSLVSEDSCGKRDLSETGTLEGCVGLIVELCTGASGESRLCENSSSINSPNPAILLTVSNCHASDSDDERWSGLMRD